MLSNEIEKNIFSMTREDINKLRELIRYRMEILNIETKALFKEGQKVHFTSKSGEIEDCIIEKINKKYIIVRHQTISHKRWNVSPSLLTAL